PLLILGGAFLPASLFPQGLINIARFNPIYHMNESLVGVSSQGADLSKITSHFWFLLVFALVMVIGGWLSYRRMLMVERRL
ncbi:ABC transporter permease, partial [Nodularia spumigena CS-590/02]